MNPKRYSLMLLVMTISLTVNEQPNWKKPHHFHETLSANYHPVEQNNMKPTLKNAGELLKRAKLWQQSLVPFSGNKNVIQQKMKALVAGCSLLKKQVDAGENDAVLKWPITAIHTTFHQIAEQCLDDKNEHKSHEA